MSASLEIEQVEAGYGRTKVLRGLSLSVPDKGRIGVCGPNGHGKSTLMKVVSGLLPLWGGRVRFDGEDLSAVEPHAIVERGLIHVAQANRLFPDLTVAENLRLGAYSRRARPHESTSRKRVLNLFPRLAERLAQKCRTLSGGERQMLAIGVGLMARPRLLILDEPNLGLAPILKIELGKAIARIAEENVSMIVIEQDVEFLLRLVDYLYVVEHGEVTYEVAADADVDHEDIISRYFGED